MESELQEYLASLDRCVVLALDTLQHRRDDHGGGPSPERYSSILFNSIVSNPRSIDVQITDIYDKKLADELHHLENCNTIPAIDSCLESMDTLIEFAGICTLVKKSKDHFEIIKEVCWRFVVGRTPPALESFKEGLNTLGVLPAIKCQPKAFQQVFCYQENFYATTFDALFKVDRGARGTPVFFQISTTFCPIWLAIYPRLELA